MKENIYINAFLLQSYLNRRGVDEAEFAKIADLSVKSAKYLLATGNGKLLNTGNINKIVGGLNIPHNDAALIFFG